MTAQGGDKNSAILNKMTIEDLGLRGKRVLMRVDFNVPFDDDLNITDDRRIREALPTINFAIDEGARVILCSHLGRPKGQVAPKLSLRPIVKRLSRVLNKEVRFSESCVGPQAEKAVKELEPGGVLLLENLRFDAREEKNDPDFAAGLAKLADVFVNDAFGTAHRAHASTAGVAKLLPSAAGFLMKREIQYLLGAVQNPVRPFTAILGGAKVSGKIGVIENLEKSVDKVIIGGGMAFTFIKAMGHEVGDSLVEDDMLELANNIRKQARARKIGFYLPVDCVAAESLDPGAPTKIVTIQEIPRGWKALDIGPASMKLFSEALANSKTIFWNGPMGMFEVDAFSRGTFAMARAIADAYALTIVGGGDTDLAVHLAGVTDNISFISTGGGASLQLLEGKSLPGLVSLTDKTEAS